jgi:acetyl-CoA carboxylase carboxyl transferase subunit beta
VLISLTLKIQNLHRPSERSKSKNKLTDSIRNAVGTVKGVEMVVSCMDFAFIGGSLGSVMGEKIRRAIDYCIKHKFLI